MAFPASPLAAPCGNKTSATQPDLQRSADVEDSRNIRPTRGNRHQRHGPDCASDTVGDADLITMVTSSFKMAAAIDTTAVILDGLSDGNSYADLRVCDFGHIDISESVSVD